MNRCSLLTILSAGVALACGRAVPEAVQLTSGTARWTEPRWSPDGRSILATARSEAGDWNVHIINADGSGFRLVSPTPRIERNASWSPTGAYVVFESNRDSRSRSDIYMMNLASGTVRRLTTDTTSELSPLPSPDGSMVAFMSHRRGAIGALHVIAVDVPNARERELAWLSRYAYDHRWSPDGRRLTVMTTGRVEDRAGLTDLHIVSLDSAPRPFIATPQWEGRARWSPDGQRLLFLQGDMRRPTLSVAGADGSDARPLVQLEGRVSEAEWCPDNQHVVFALFSSTNQDIYAFRLRDSAIVRLTADPGNDMSPDCGAGGRVAFTSNRSGTMQLYVVTIPSRP